MLEHALENPASNSFSSHTEYSEDGILAHLLETQHEKDTVEKNLISSLVVSLGKTFKGISHLDVAVEWRS